MTGSLAGGPLSVSGITYSVSQPGVGLMPAALLPLPMVPFSLMLVGGGQGTVSVQDWGLNTDDCVNWLGRKLLCLCSHSVLKVAIEIY